MSLSLLPTKLARAGPLLVCYPWSLEKRHQFSVWGQGEVSISQGLLGLTVPNRLPKQKAGHHSPCTAAYLPWLLNTQSPGLVVWGPVGASDWGQAIQRWKDLGSELGSIMIILLCASVSSSVPCTQ